MNIQDQYGQDGTIQSPQRSPISQLGLFLAVSYSKQALIECQGFASISAKNWSPPPPLAIQVPPALISTLAMHAFLGDLYRGVSRIISILGEQHDAWILEAPQNFSCTFCFVFYFLIYLGRHTHETESKNLSNLLF